MSLQIKHNMSNRFTLSACAVVIAAAVSVVAPAWASASEAAGQDDKSMSSEKMDHSKTGDMKPMEGMSMTGDVDYDFAANMRMHHQMAVDMSQAELKSGKNPQMLQMAKDIIAAQKKEIAVLDLWMKAHKKP